MAAAIFSFIAHELGEEKLRKIAEKKEKKFPSIWAYIYHYPMCESFARIFQMKND